VPETGVAVTCPKCGHVFRLLKKALVVTVPLRPEEAEQAQPLGGLGPRPQPVAAPVREWRLRQASGSVFPFRELTTLQKWIVERKVGRDDEISASGDQWRRLGDIPELESFFKVVEAADRAPAQPPPGRPPAPDEGPLTWAGRPPPATSTIGEPAWAQGVAHAPPPSAPLGRPRPARGRGRLWLGLLALVLAAGVVGAWLYLARPALEPLPPAEPVPVPDAGPPPAPVKAAEPPRPRAPAAAPLPAATPATSIPAEVAAVIRGSNLPGPIGAPARTSAPAGSEAAAAAPLAAPAAAAAPVPDAGPIPDGGAPAPVEAAATSTARAAAPEPPVPPAAAVAKPPAKPAPPPRKAVAAAAPPKGVKALVAEARKLRERGRTEAALNLYAQAIDIEPTNAQALAGRGACYLEISEYPPAEANFRAALDSDPRNAEALFGMAETQRYMGHKAEAVTFYQRFLAAHPQGDDAVAARNAISQLKE